MKKIEAIIHLLASSLAALISAIFAFAISSIQTSNARCLGIVDALPNPAAFYSSYSPFALALPFVLCVAGLLCRRLKNNPNMAVVIICYLGWLFALFWTLGCIFSWQLPYVQICPEIK